MKKVLRSLILETFPQEVRVKIELLSKRRGMTNNKKKEELLNILKEANLLDKVVPLGSGTNRYAFKIKGYVIKIATDNDGKIDNFKEFRMAKVLYPMVAKTYEVSTNGTMLVAEYIQLFGSFAEMKNYQNEIKEILKKLSRKYLIGDVGITSKNYSNWGTRLGTNTPVCLDFAYVYETGSKIFLCSNCNSRSMLVPTEDFVNLVCPKCRHTYSFEDIRRRIGNDVHSHEIGDLTEISYELSESRIEVDLDPSKSRYLLRKDKKEEDKPVVKEEVEEESDSFQLIHEPRWYIGKSREEIEKEKENMRIYENSYDVELVDPDKYYKKRSSRNYSEFDRKFILSAATVVSSLSRMMIQDVKNNDVYNEVYDNLPNNIDEKLFYGKLKACIYKTMLRFCKFEKVEDEDFDGCQMIRYVFPKSDNIDDVKPTLKILEEYFNVRDEYKDPDELIEYMSIVSDKDCRLQFDFFDQLSIEIMNTFGTDDITTTRIYYFIYKSWFIEELEQDESINVQPEREYIDSDDSDNNDEVEDESFVINNDEDDDEEEFVSPDIVILEDSDPSSIIIEVDDIEPKQKVEDAVKLKSDIKEDQKPDNHENKEENEDNKVNSIDITDPKNIDVVVDMIINKNTENEKSVNKRKQIIEDFKNMDDNQSKEKTIYKPIRKKKK